MFSVNFRTELKISFIGSFSWLITWQGFEKFKGGIHNGNPIRSLPASQ
jgi:hypothetical protein